MATVRNTSADVDFSTASSQVAVWVIPTNEELMIAQHTLALACG
jgi:acetate kinase